MHESSQHHPQVSRLKTTSAIYAGVPDKGMVIASRKGQGGESLAGNASTALRLYPSGYAADTTIWCAYRPPMGSKGQNRDFLSETN